MPGFDIKEFEDEKVFSGYKKKNEEATIVDLDIDLCDMICHDSFLGENFIKCLFRYYSQLTDYIKEIFFDHYRENISENES